MGGEGGGGGRTLYHPSHQKDAKQPQPFLLQNHFQLSNLLPYFEFFQSSDVFPVSETRSTIKNLPVSKLPKSLKLILCQLI